METNLYCFNSPINIHILKIQPDGWNAVTRYDGPEHWGIPDRFKHLFPADDTPGTFIDVVSCYTVGTGPQSVVFYFFPRLHCLGGTCCSSKLPERSHE